MNKITYIILFSIITTSLNAQFFRIRFEHLSVTEGLSQSSVRSISQDKNGFTWFATLDGLNKFDGYDIYTYYAGNEPGELPDNVISSIYTTPDSSQQLWIGTADHGICLYNNLFDSFVKISKENNPNTLIDDHITCISGNSKILWIGTEHGLSKFNQKENTWTNFPNLNNQYITCIMPADNGFVWIGTKNGLFLLEQSLREPYLVGQDVLPSNYISALTKDNNGNFWIGTSNGIVFYDATLKQFIFKDAYLKLPDLKISALKSDFENILWIGTLNGGVVRFDPKTEQMRVFVYNPTDPNSISVNSILDIYEDKNHLLWFGTSLGGVDKWNRAAQELLVFRHNPYNDNSLSSSRVRSIFEDTDGTIWIGTVDGGLNKWVQKLQKFIAIKHDPNNPKSIPENHIRAIMRDSKGRFWIGTAYSGACIINEKNMNVSQLFTNNPLDSNSIAGNKIWRIIEDNDNNIWFATYGGGISMLYDDVNFKFKNFTNNLDNPKSLSNNFCTTIFCDSKNRIWIGTNEGLNMLNPDKETFTIFKNKIDDSTSLSNNRIYSIIEGSDGHIWIGTKGGLNRYMENGTFQTFTVKSHDLANNVIMGILEDTAQNLWLTTNQGLCKFNMKTYKNRSYDVQDGLQSNEFLVGSFLLTKDKMFIVGGINGFNAFYPDKIKDNPNLPSIVITDFMISNDSYDLDTSISEKKYLTLNHKQNDLTFKFVAIDYILPEKNQYAYMLEGYDDDWIYCKYIRNAKYTNLPPGHYTFKVIGSNNDLIWNEDGANINLYIKPAYWQTWAFKISVSLFVILSVVFVAWLRLRILRKQKRLLKEEVDRQTFEIRQQNELLQQQKEEIITQRDEIEQQKEIAVNQRDVIALHTKEIEDSIIYAKRIQTAALPENKIIQMMFNEFFILFMPRDIVSGDFYWASPKDGKLIAVAADCTGHGVPGAFMSMLGISFLHKIVNEKGITEADKILNRLRTNVINSLKQTVEGESKDGMDITICVIDKNDNTIELSGANNPMYLIRNNELTEYKVQKMPIAIYDEMKSFEKQIIKYQKGDILYMFSDGYADQFGGPKGKKFRYNNFKKLLLNNHKLPMIDQKKQLSTTMQRWMSYPDPYTNEKAFQIDDIIVFGIKL